MSWSVGTPKTADIWVGEFAIWMIDIENVYPVRLPHHLTTYEYEYTYI